MSKAVLGIEGACPAKSIGMARAMTLLVLVLACGVPAKAAVRGNKAKYVGGTITEVAEQTDGEFDLSGQDAAVFAAKGGTRITIPYSSIESLEFGQKAGRRIGAAVVVSPLFLFSKKRKHFLSIGYKDELGNRQGAVFELAKGIVRPTLATFEARTGKQIEYESEDARKHIGN